MAEDKIITENESKPPKPKPKKDKKIDKNKTIGQVLDDLENDKFVCYYCDKIFSGLKFLQNHWKKHCDENGNMPCRQCERAFETRKKLRQHQINAHEPKYCNDCNKTFVSSGSLKRSSFALFLH